jgi:CPA2 family monovalent cation:H+ antiporter-2
MEGISLLADFAVILLVAGVVGWLFRKIGLSAVVGFLVAGVIIGPYTPPFTLVSDIDRIEALSDLGLVFLMFFVGLGLSLKRIKRMGPPLVAATAVTALSVFNLAQIFAWTAGWSQTVGLIFAAMLMTSSSAIITKMLAELGLTHERFGQNAQGVTVLEDVVAVVMLTVIGSQLHVAGSGSQNVGQTLFLLLGFTALAVVLGLIFVPRLLRRVSQSSDADLKSLLVSGLAFGAGVVSISAGFSVALGAFLFGVVIAETPFKAQIEKRLAGAQDMFSAIFFVSIGMLIDVRAFWENAGLILAVAAFAIAARVASATFGLITTGSHVSLAASSAIVLTPIGEFSYIIAQIGVSAGAVPKSFYAVAVGTSIVTAALAPAFARHAARFGARVESLQPPRLQCLLDRYRIWLHAVAARAAKNQVWQLTRRRIAMTLLELLMLAGLFGFAKPVRNGISAFLGKAGYDLPGWIYAFWSAVVVVAVILIVAVWRSLHALSMIYAEILTMRAEQAPFLRPVVQLAFQILGAVGLGVLVFFTFPIQTTVPWLAILLIVAPLVFAAVLWRQLVRIHGRFESSLARAVEQSGTSGTRIAKVTESKRRQDWNMDVVECVLPDHATCSGKTIGGMSFRSRFGCSILEINRQGYIISRPRPDAALFPGDRVLIVGTEDQIQIARQFLSRELPLDEALSDFDDAALDAVDVPETSPVVGKTLAESQIFTVTGVQIMGIERGERRILNPSGSERIEAGDRLLVIAAGFEIRLFRDWLEPRSNPDPDGAAT